MLLQNQNHESSRLLHSTPAMAMKLSLLTSPPSLPLIPRNSSTQFPYKLKPLFSKLSICSAISSPQNNLVFSDLERTEFNNVSIGTPIAPAMISLPKWTPSDQASFLITFIVCTASVSFTSLVFALVPTITAMGRAAIALSKLADTAREELPSTMSAIRLSGMELSDLTLELSDLSHEIADGVSKSAQAVQAAETGLRQIGSRARQRTVAMIQERANLPPISIQPVVAGAAKKTSRAVSQATKSIMNLISGEENEL